VLCFVVRLNWIGVSNVTYCRRIDNGTLLCVCVCVCVCVTVAADAAAAAVITVLYSIPCIPGYSGVFRGIPGVFRGYSGGIPGVSQKYRGNFHDRTYDVHLIHSMHTFDIFDSFDSFDSFPVFSGLNPPTRPTFTHDVSWKFPR
jgi:hypothetical protein